MLILIVVSMVKMLSVHKIKSSLAPKSDLGLRERPHDASGFCTNSWLRNQVLPKVVSGTLPWVSGGVHSHILNFLRFELVQALQAPMGSFGM